MASKDSVEAPFSDEQVSAINEYQKNPSLHPLTCCGHNGCERDDRNLLAQTNCLVCPCGQYKQNWVHTFIAVKNPQS